MEMFDCAKHLDGWLTTEQVQYISKNFKPCTELARMATQLPLDLDDIYGPLTVYALKAWRLYEPRKNNPALEVLQAFYHARVQLRELRILSLAMGQHIEFSCLPKSLRTLCIPVWTRHFQDEEQAFLKALKRLEKLQDLILLWERDDSQTVLQAQTWTDGVF